MKSSQSSLPPGFRFHPTDEELIAHYLKKKLTNHHFPCSIIADVDIYKFNPWELPDKAAVGEKEWYFFSPRDRKYPNGARPNRSAASGYWKATGTDKVIATSSGSDSIGVKKALVFYKGKPPKGTKTNWIMHEYRLSDTSAIPKTKDSSMRLDDWVLCRIYMKHQHNAGQSTTSSYHDVEEEVMTRRQAHDQSPVVEQSPSLSDVFEPMDYTFLSNLFVDAPPDMTFEASNQSFSDIAPWEQSSFFIGGGSSSGFNGGHVDNPSAHVIGMDNRQKRQLSGFDDDDDLLQPSKKYVNSCNFAMELGQYNFFNHQMFLSPHISNDN